MKVALYDEVDIRYPLRRFLRPSIFVFKHNSSVQKYVVESNIYSTNITRQYTLDSLSFPKKKHRSLIKLSRTFPN